MLEALKFVPEDELVSSAPHPTIPEPMRIETKAVRSFMSNPSQRHHPIAGHYDFGIRQSTPGTGPSRRSLAKVRLAPLDIRDPIPFGFTKYMNWSANAFY